MSHGEYATASSGCVGGLVNLTMPVPRVLITDQLKSYAAAKREVMPGVEHRQSRSLNNRCENSHRSTRERERRMQRFKSPGQAQRFLSAYGPIAQHFRPRRHLLAAPAYRQEMRPSATARLPWQQPRRAAAAAEPRSSPAGPP